MKKKNYTDEEFKEAVEKSRSYSGVCRLIGLSPKSGNIKTVKNKIKEMNLDLSHFTFQRWNKGLTGNDHSSIKKKPLNEIFISNSGWSSHNIRLKLFKENIKEKKCEQCGRTTWEGVDIPLELHHINGIHTDNRLSNLKILCPNCHALISVDSKFGRYKKTEEVKETGTSAPVVTQDVEVG